MSITIAVLGGGAAGVVAAKMLSERPDTSVDLVERAPKLGGLHRSIQVDGMTFDIGAFTFEDGHDLIATFPFLEDVFVPAFPKLVSITPSGNIDSYPISVRGYLRDNGLPIFLYSVADLLCSRIRHRRKNDVPTYAKYYMGSTIYEKSGLRNYIERLYGLKDYQVGLEFAKQRLAAIEYSTPEQIVRRMLRRARKLRKAPPRPQLVRPPGGFGIAYELIREHLESRGTNIYLQARPKSLARTTTGFELTTETFKRRYDRVISTIPIPAALELIGEPARATFDQMSLLTLFYHGNVRHDAAIQCNFTLSGSWKRMIVFSKYYGRHQGLDYCSVEITTRDTSHAARAELRSDFERHARDLRLFVGDPKYVGESATKVAYPVFRKGDSEKLQMEREKLQRFGIDLLGRQGNFEYLSSSGASRNAKAVVAGI